MESIKNEQKREAHRAPPFLGISLNNGRIDFCCQVDRLGHVSVALSLQIGLIDRQTQPRRIFMGGQRRIRIYRRTDVQDHFLF